MTGTADGGFTLIEVIIAMALLGMVVLGGQAVLTDQLASRMVGVDERSLSRQLVEDRLHLARTEPSYSEIEGRFEGVEDPVADYPGFTRTTVVAPRQGYTIVTVEVVSHAVGDTVRGTAVIGAP